jgi:hypothetical protein
MHLTPTTYTKLVGHLLVASELLRRVASECTTSAAYELAMTHADAIDQLLKELPSPEGSADATPPTQGPTG